MARRRQAAQLVVLLLASYIFYAWWRLDFLALILFSSGIDFAMGAAIHRSNTQARKKLFLILSLVANLGLLGYFKYCDFFIAQINRVLELAGLAPLGMLSLILPVGISFYTFQSMSYTIDIYRGELTPTPSLPRFLFFVAAFPQLVAGPIVRAREFLPQLTGNLAARSDPSGLWLVLYGLFKKMVVADQVGAFLVDPCFADPAAFSSLELVLGSYAYAFQIFLDFSGLLGHRHRGWAGSSGWSCRSTSGCPIWRPTPGSSGRGGTSPFPPGCATTSISPWAAAGARPSSPCAT